MYTCTIEIGKDNHNTAFNKTSLSFKQTILKLAVTLHVFKTFYLLEISSFKNSRGAPRYQEKTLESSGCLEGFLDPGGRPTTDPESSGRLEGFLDPGGRPTTDPESSGRLEGSLG